MQTLTMLQLSLDGFRDRIHLIRSEYAEMPGLHLSKRQARRLWNLEADAADAIFEALEEAHYLKRARNGDYVRADIGCY